MRDSSKIESASSQVAVEPLAVRARDAARALGISERALWSATKSGSIPCVRIGRTITYPVDALRDWLRKRAKGGK